MTSPLEGDMARQILMECHPQIMVVADTVAVVCASFKHNESEI